MLVKMVYNCFVFIFWNYFELTLVIINSLVQVAVAENMAVWKESVLIN